MRQFRDDSCRCLRYNSEQIYVETYRDSAFHSDVAGWGARATGGGFHAIAGNCCLPAAAQTLANQLQDWNQLGRYYAIISA